ncbi:MAG: tyrosine-protein phosphatase [Rhodobacteraceae bacterium]|nr:tyrosine-protein phosphatase [Paracoccaceae bacterium]
MTGTSRARELLIGLKSRFRGLERALRDRFGRDISTPRARRHAFWHFQLLDHAFLRIVWWNLAEIAPDVWRSNQPSPSRLKRYKRMGIRSVINLRGEARQSPFLFEQEACRELGLTLHNITLSARKLVPRENILQLIELMRTAERPFVLHCKSGSDRAGFASAIYLAVIEGKPVSVARRQLHWRFLHLASTDTGILDHVFDVYEADTHTAPMDFETWVKTRYDHEALTQSWNAKRAG